MRQVVEEQGGPEGKDAGALVQAVVAFAEQLLKEDVQTNKAIGDHGANAILSNAPGSVSPVVEAVGGSGYRSASADEGRLRGTRHPPRRKLMS
jgi:hypothetical protein